MMHRLISSKEREARDLEIKIEGLKSLVEEFREEKNVLKSLVEEFREEKNVLESEIEALRQERTNIQFLVAAKKMELLNLQKEVDDHQHQDSGSVSPSLTAHKAFICDSTLSITDSYQSFNERYNWQGLSGESDDSLGLNSVLELSCFKGDQLPTAEVLEAAVASASVNSTNVEDPAEGRTATYILMTIYEQDYQMGLEFWTKLVRILALHELWSDVEMLIGIASEQHPEFSPPVDVLEAMILRVLRFQKNREKELKKLKSLIGESEGLLQMSKSVKSRVRSLLMFSQQIRDDELHAWLASFTNWG